jgi:O-antigen/teichoic acid export membrane protein
MGAILGLGCGLWLSGAATGIVGLVLYRRLKLPLAPLFHAGFDRKTVRDLVRFGAAVAAGKLPYFAANFAEVAILTLLLPAYPSWLGIRQLLYGRILFTLWFVWPFLSSGVPAFAEALAAPNSDDHALARRYLERYLQLGHLFVAMLIALTVGAGPSLIRLALPAEWHPAADYLPLAAAVGAFLPLSWLADALQLGAGRSGLNAALLGLEQALRVALFWLLVPRLGFAGIFVAILASIALESALSWWLNHRLIFPLALPLWPTVGAPFAAAALFGAALHFAARLVTTAPSAIALFVAAALLAFPAGFLLCNALGGFSDEARAEIAQAAELASFMRPIARLLARCARSRLRT